MAAVQRKLVHKQFNSPIGLYSDQNVQETVDRELRAFSNGTIGIDVGDARKQVNLANSAVLKMVEEEEYEKSHPEAANERKSRPRNRYISREDLLKINRRHPRRNISWPPSDDRSISRTSSEESHFGERVQKYHENFHFKEMLDRGAIAKNKRNISLLSSGKKITDDCISQVANPSNTKSAKFNDSESAKCQHRWPPKSYYANDDGKKVSKKAFHLAKNDWHIGKIEPIRKHFHNISSRSAATSLSLSQPGLAQGYYAAGAKRWRSHENITLAYNTPSSGCYSQLAAENSHKKDNLPLERYKSNSYNELPPLKPRREHHKIVHSTKKKLNLNNSQRMEATKSDENLKIDSSENYTNVAKIIGFQVDELHDGTCGLNVENRPPEINNCSSFHPKNSSELGSTASDQNGRNGFLHSPDLMHNNNSYVGQPIYDLAPSIAKYETEMSAATHSTLSAKINTIVNSPHIFQHQDNATAHDDGDQTDQLNRISEPNIMSVAGKVSREVSHKFPRRPNDTTPGGQNSACNENLLYGTGPTLSGTNTETNNEEKFEQSKGNATYRDLFEESFVKGSNDERKRGMYYTDGEFIWGPYASQQSEGDASPQLHEQDGSESLSMKRILMEKAITQDILRINEYMKKAEQEVLDAERYVNESVTSTPLQSILKHIMLQKGLSHIPNPISKLSHPFDCFDPMAIQIENMPVVDQALIDLLKISRVLETLNNDNSNTTPDDNRSTRITEIDETREATSADAISPTDSTSTCPVLSSTSRTASGTTIVDKIIQSKNILSGYLITKQGQEQLFENIHSTESKIRPDSSTSPSTVLLDLVNGKTFPTSSYTNDGNDDDDYAAAADQNKPQQLHLNNFNDPPASDKILSGKDNLYVVPGEKIMGPERLADGATKILSRKDDKLIEKSIKLHQQETCQTRNTVTATRHDNNFNTERAIYFECTQPHHPLLHFWQPSGDEPVNYTLPATIGTGTSDEVVTDYRQHSGGRQHQYNDTEQQKSGYKRVAWPPASDGIAAYPAASQTQPQSSYQNQNQYQPQTTQAFQPVSQQQPPVQESHQAPSYQQPQSQKQSQVLPNYSQAPQYTPYGRGLSVGVIQLRQEAPVSQKPSPIFTSQPAAASFKGGSNMRGDIKWPPTEYKVQAAAENEARRKLALGPLFRPRRVNKDYSQFFAKHALNSYYPGYKIPPGTQHMYAEF